MAVATEPEQLVAKPAEGRQFVAFREDLYLVKAARYPVLGAGGRQVGEERGEAVQFKHHRLDVPSSGEVQIARGIKIDAQDLLAWIDVHPLLGDPQQGFVEIEQSAPPISTDEQKRMMGYAMRLQVDKLEEMLEQEKQGWARKDLIGLLGDSIAEITEALANKKA